MTLPMTTVCSRIRRLALTVTVVLLLAACAPWGMPDGGSGGMFRGDMHMGDGDRMSDMHGDARGAGEDRAPAPVEDATEVHITASEMAFVPAELDLVTGEVVNITVTNGGQVFHDFVLDAAGVDLNLDPGEQAAASLRLDDPGIHEAICTVPGHAAAGMVLRITVRQA